MLHAWLALQLLHMLLLRVSNACFSCLTATRSSCIRL
jgi:hypothetical protein